MERIAILKCIILVSLLALFYLFYFRKVINLYASGKSNYSKSSNIVENGTKCPAITFCFTPEFKPSKLSDMNIAKDFFFMPDKEVLDRNNMSLEDAIDQLSYKIGRDFTLKAGNLNITLLSNLKVGENLIKVYDVVGNVIHLKYEVREVFSLINGLCYTILG